MTQKLRYFCTLLLMAVVGVAWAQSDYSITETSNVALAAGTNGSACTVNGENGIKVGTSSKGGDMKVTVPAGTAFLHVHAAAWKGVTGLSLNISGVTASPASIALTANDGVSNNSPFTLSGNASDYYFVIELSNITAETTLTFTTSTNKRFVIWGVNAEEDGGGTTALATTTTIDASDITNTDVYTSTAAGSLTATVTETESGAAVSGATVTWTSSNESVATVASDGTVTLVAAGTTTITASYAGVEDEYKASSATYQLTVTNSDPNAPGTENNPYTVAQARAAIDANTGVTGVYATGIVSEIVTPLNTQYGNISYNISVDGTTTADQLQAFRGKSYNGEIFTSADDIKVGDEVVVYGNLKKYNTTYEFDADNQLVSLNRPVSEDPAVTLDDYTIDVPVEGANGILTVQYQNIDDVAADVQFYDENGNEVDANYYEVWLTASLDEDNNVNYIAIENYGEARTAYFKVFALVGNDYVYSDMITITQAAYVAPSIATLPFEFNGGRAAIEETDGLTQEGLGSDYASEPKLKFENKNGQISSLLLQFDEEPGKLSFDIKGNNFSGGTFTVQTSEDGVTFTDLASYTELGATQNEEFKNLDANVRFIKWIYTNKSSGNVGLGNIKLEKPATSATITIKDGFKATTFSCDKALDFTGQNIAAYIITDENGATAQVTKVPANTGLYIERGDTEGTISYDIPFLTNEADAEKITGNLLVGTISEPVNTKTLEGNYTYYLFGKQNGKEAFFKVGENTSDAKATASAGKAYLAVPGAGNAKEMIVIGGDVTGIESIENGTIVNDNYYTIDGKLVKGQPTQKGIYVVNGRKVVIK